MKPSSLIVGVLLVSALLCACGDRGGEGAAPASAPPPDPEAAARGRALYTEHGCDACHGESLEGMEGIPALAGLTDRWTVDALVRYLEDPVAYGDEDPDVRAMQERYPDWEMPAFGHVSEEDRRALAAWLLEPPGE